MKIDDRLSTYMSLLNDDFKSATRPPDVDGSAPASIEAASVAVAISPTASQLAEDEARRERLNTIRQQLTAGSYNISGKNVADKILGLLKP